MKNLWRPAISLFILLLLITGTVYPLVVTAIGKFVFPAQAAGSLIVVNGKAVGSTLIGQNFSDPRHFWGRLSATGPYPYNAAASSGSNFGPSNPALADAIKARVDALKAADPGNSLPTPVDLVTASGSGLDPEISPAAAEYQIGRVARMRGMSPDALRDLVAKHTKHRQWQVFGEPRVNVLTLNLALDATH